MCWGGSPLGVDVQGAEGDPGEGEHGVSRWWSGVGASVASVGGLPRGGWMRLGCLWGRLGDTL